MHLSSSLLKDKLKCKPEREIFVWMSIKNRRFDDGLTWGKGERKSLRLEEKCLLVGRESKDLFYYISSGTLCQFILLLCLSCHIPQMCTPSCHILEGVSGPQVEAQLVGV